MNKGLLILMPFVLAACAVGPDYERPASEIPDSFERASGNAGELEQWWRSFNDARLEGYVKESLVNNSDLRVAVANVDAAAAALRLSRADLYPDVDGQAQAVRSESSGNAAFPTAQEPQTEYNVGLVVNYEIDIWGRIRRASEAALADLAADTAVMQGVRATVAANVARTYFLALSLDRQIALLDRQYQTRTDNVRLQKVRLDGGLISPYEYQQARSESAAVAARLPELRAARQQAITALAVLRGTSARVMYAEWQEPVASAKVTPMPAAPAVPMDLPSAMLERRPDVRAAEQRMVAANARIGEARARYFPRVSLTGFVGAVATSIDDLWDSDSESWNAAGNANVPIVSAFTRIAADVDSAEARREAAAASYAGTVRTAFQETLDAISKVDANGDILRAQDERVDALRIAYRVATARYKSGRIGYLDVLDVERQLLEVEQQQVGARLSLLQATVDLYRALGGGWQQAAS